MFALCLEVAVGSKVVELGKEGQIMGVNSVRLALLDRGSNVVRLRRQRHAARTRLAALDPLRTRAEPGRRG